jgi:hypothetical protein
MEPLQELKQQHGQELEEEIQKELKQEHSTVSQPMKIPNPKDDNHMKRTWPPSAANQFIEIGIEYITTKKENLVMRFCTTSHFDKLEPNEKPKVVLVYLTEIDYPGGVTLIVDDDSGFGCWLNPKLKDEFIQFIITNSRISLFCKDTSMVIIPRKILYEKLIEMGINCEKLMVKRPNLLVKQTTKVITKKQKKNHKKKKILVIKETTRIIDTKKETKETSCVVCLDKGATHTFLPCGHLCICETCFNHTAPLTNCLICRASFTEVKKIYQC